MCVCVSKNITLKPYEIYNYILLFEDDVNFFHDQSSGQVI